MLFRSSLRDAAIGTGIAVDKMLALTGQTPALQIANIVMPSEEECGERRAIHARLDAIARTLADTGERPVRAGEFAEISAQKNGRVRHAAIDRDSEARGEK